jgi:predicted secreted protein
MVPILALVACVAGFDDVSYVPGKTALLKVNDTFTVKLSALPGAGYTWQPTTDGRDNLRFTSVKTLPIKNGTVGGKQTMVFRFLATGAGPATITFHYGRPWEMKKGAPPEKTLAIPVTVK